MYNPMNPNINNNVYYQQYQPVQMNPNNYQPIYDKPMNIYNQANTPMNPNMNCNPQQMYGQQNFMQNSVDNLNSPQPIKT